MRPALTCTILALLTAPLQAAELPDAITAPGETLVTTAHAVGSQVYECEFDTVGNLVWQFREPIATLFVSGKTIGRHYAGPTWELIDGSVARGKVISSAPPASPADIPVLNLEVAARPRSAQHRHHDLETQHPWRRRLRGMQCTPRPVGRALHRRLRLLSQERPRHG